MERKSIKIEEFSKHLFWDTDRGLLDFEKNRSYIIKQVLEYGMKEDWEKIKDYYGIEKIGETAKMFRELEPKALSFISLLSGIAKEKFRCYTTLKSMFREILTENQIRFLPLIESFA
ncbi:MAG: hypothetical protein WC644_01575 [Ignavibacteria bacterium]